MRLAHPDQEAVDRSHGVGAPVAGRDHDRWQLLVGLQVLRHPDVRRQVDPVAHREVTRGVARESRWNGLLARDRIEIHEIAKTGAHDAKSNDADYTDSTPAGHGVHAAPAWLGMRASAARPVAERSSRPTSAAA